MSAASAKHTPLHDLHVEMGAKMVDFAGWSMPMQYANGIISEHNQCRDRAALFDVSHMGQIELRGADVSAKLERLVPADITSLEKGKARYTQFTNELGGILDDLIVTNAGDHLFLVVNASMCAQDILHMQQQLKDIELVERTDRALLAIQGPDSAAVVTNMFPTIESLKFMESKEVALSGVTCRVSRMGYTGEDGFEISIPSSQAQTIARSLLANEKCELAGLGARDTLRLEAGLCLYGNDIDNETTPVEASLLWSIQKRRREEGGFIGADRILDDIENGVKRKLVGIKPDGRAPARRGAQIEDLDGNQIGSITSGGFGPTVGSPVAMGYVSTAFSEKGTAVNINIRGKSLPAEIAPLPFVTANYKR